MRFRRWAILFCIAASCEAGDEEILPDVPAWSVDTVPRLNIAHADEPLYGVRDVAVSAGRIVVANGGNHSIAVFDSAGRLLEVFGRKGAGPGEFEAVSNVYFLANDSVLTFDPRLRRFQVFDGGGSYMRSFFFSGIDDAAVGTTDPVAVLNTEVIVARSIPAGEARQESAGVVRATAYVLRFAMDGQLLDTVAIVPGWEAYNTQVDGLLMTNIPIPFSNFTFMDGAAGRLVLALSDSNEVRVYSADGVLLHTVRDAAPPGQQITPEEIQAFEKGVLQGAHPQMRRQLEEVYAEMPHPNTKPPISGAYAGIDSSTWVRKPGRSTAAEAFIIFDRDGVPIGTLRLPSELNPMAVSEESVLGVWTDSLGVESVRAFRVRR